MRKENAFSYFEKLNKLTFTSLGQRVVHCHLKGAAIPAPPPDSPSMELSQHLGIFNSLLGGSSPLQFIYIFPQKWQTPISSSVDSGTLWGQVLLLRLQIQIQKIKSLKS